jgi:CHAT domain-containing protein
LHRASERIASTRGKEPVSDAMASIWDLAISPVLGELRGIRNLILIPSPELMGLPLEAAAKDSDPLGERFVVSYAPSATLFAWGRSRSAESRVNTRSSGYRILALADPPFQKEQARQLVTGAPQGATDRGTGFSLAEVRPDQLPRLTHSRAEIEALRPFAAQGSSLLLGTQCREEAIVKFALEGSLERFDLIHIATHTWVNRSFPERSALVLSQVDLADRRHALIQGERLYDGLISVAEVLREWKLNADLVSLSACQTGLGKKTGGEGYLGFAQAFLQKGARSLVVSLWSVDDQSTSLLFKRFYANLLTSSGDSRPSKAEALQEAKAWLRKYETPDGRHPYSHPYYWAGFILLGDRD